MPNRLPVALLLMLGLISTTFAQTTPVLDKDAARIRGQVEDLAVGHPLTVKLKNGDYYHGTITKIDPDNFEMAEVDLKQVVKFRYAEIKSLYGAYGGKNAFGKRPNPKHDAIIAAGVLGGIMLVVALCIPKT